MQDTTYWIKTLSDGSLEKGLWQDTQTGKASWTKGRSDIVKSSLFYAGKLLTLEADQNCPFFQFDNYTTVLGAGAGTMRGRELGCLVPRKYKVFVTGIDGKKPVIIVGSKGKSLPQGSRGISCQISFDGQVTVRYF